MLQNARLRLTKGWKQHRAPAEGLAGAVDRSEAIFQGLAPPGEWDVAGQSCKCAQGRQHDKGTPVSQGFGQADLDDTSGNTAAFAGARDCNSTTHV